MINLSSRGRYATRIMVCLARRGDVRPASVQEIAKAEALSPDYVEQILIRLKTGGLVSSRRGVKGGFSLARDASQITVQDVIKAVEGGIALAPCLVSGCERATDCATRLVWEKATQALETVFAANTLAQLARYADSREAASTLMYEI